MITTTNAVSISHEAPQTYCHSCLGCSCHDYNYKDNWRQTRNGR